MLAFKHNAGGYGTPGTPAFDAETSGGPISLHTAIAVLVFCEKGQSADTTCLDSLVVIVGPLFEFREHVRQRDTESLHQSVGRHA